MTVDAYGVTKFLGKLIHDTNPGMPTWITGAQKVTNEKEWICYRLLAHSPIPSRRTQSRDHYFIEIACYCRHANSAQGIKINRPWELAKVYKDLLHQKDYIIESSCLRFLEARLIYQDLSSMGNQIQNISLQSPNLNLHSVHIEIEAMVLEQK